MPDLLLELFSEEIPARMQARAAADLKRLVTNGLVDAGLTYEGGEAHHTPRRLVLDLRGVSARSKAVREERKGPRVGAPDKAVEGFLRAAGLADVTQAEIRTDPKKGDHYVAVLQKPGREATAIIADLVPAIVRDFPWPKSMRWGASSRQPGSLRWVRPLQSILCTFGAEGDEPEVVRFEIDDLASGNTTEGHRFHAPGAIAVKRMDDFATKLEAARVVLSAERRREIIATEARELAFAQGLELVEDDALLAEVANLVEWPVPLLGTYDAAFLALPAEVIRLTIKENQKCFVLRDAEGNLANRFLLVSNIEAPDGGELIVRGNAKVVNARLSDAQFFWQTDLRTIETEGFDAWLGKLDQVTFHARLGSQGERVKRVAALARELAPAVGADPDLAERAARLAKADLSSQMVYEFPELQGGMGRRYADVAGEDPAVAAAIEEHYQPLGPNDDVPTAPVSIAVALADKLDLLSGFWRIDEKPSGSKDPFALRRAALGVIRLLRANRIELALLDHVEPDLLAFIQDRLKVHLRDEGVRHDLIEAVLSPDADDVLAIARRVEALGALLGSADGPDLLAGTRRAANILAAEERKGTAVGTAVDPELFETGEERALFGALEQAEAGADEALSRRDYTAAMRAIASLRGPIDAFFEAVLVNAEDEAVRANRLALMRRVRDVVRPVADLSKVEG